MPSFQDSAVLVLLALLLFGPKGLAKLARQLGRLMGEFRRASNEFRMQMEEEFRLEEQTEQQKKIESMKAAAPVVPALAAAPLFPAEPSTLPEPEHPHMPPPAPLQTDYSLTPLSADHAADHAADHHAEHHIDRRADTPLPPAPTPEPLPIASAGDLHMMPPTTGLPQPRTHASSVASVFDAIPHVPEDGATHSLSHNTDQHEPVHG